MRSYVFKRYDPVEPKDWFNTPKGHWCAFMGGDMGAGGVVKNRGWRVAVCCPDCGRVATLPHHIDPAGGVHPSIVCPYNADLVCDFHSTPNTLERWDHGDRPSLK